MKIIPFKKMIKIKSSTKLVKEIEVATSIYKERKSYDPNPVLIAQQIFNLTQPTGWFLI